MRGGRMVKTAVQQGRSDATRRGVPLRYVELRSDARTQLAVVFTILLAYSPVGFRCLINRAK